MSDNPFQYLQNAFKADNIQAVRKPKWADDTEPVWRKSVKIGETQGKDDDVRKYSQIKCWIKAPSEHYPSTASFLSIVNGKGSVFIRLNSLDELKLVVSQLASWVPEMEKVIEAQRPLEIQYQMAYQAFKEAIEQKQGE